MTIHGTKEEPVDYKSLTNSHTMMNTTASVLEIEKPNFLQKFKNLMYFLRGMKTED